MMRWSLRRTALVLALCACGPGCGLAQTFDATHLRAPANLDGKWLVKAGDDPAWANPALDDSRWQVFDPNTSLLKLFPARPEVVWYRLHVKTDPADKGLALGEQLISRAFELYANGQRLMASGQVRPYRATTSIARLLAPIPAAEVAKGEVVVALRVHIAPSEWMGQFPGYYSANLTLGQYGTLYSQNWLAVVGENLSGWLDHFLVIAVGIVALALYIAQPNQKEYLWIAALGAFELIELPVPLIETFYNVPLFWEIVTILLRVVTPLLWISLYFSFVHQRIGWRWRGVLAFAGVCNAFSGVEQYLVTPIWLQFVSSLPFIILLSVVVPIVLGVHWYRGNREAGILLIPALLFSLYIYTEVGLELLFQFPQWSALALRGLNFIDRFPAGPFAISLSHVSGILSSFSLAIIMLLRSTRMSLRQAQLESELAAAQQVQQLLVPEGIEAVAGFRVESIYQPAQQVGGDFFQILPASDGGLLIVVGDVAGKGLPAAMLVSVLVGATRALAGTRDDPAELLASLNERLVGRTGDGFSTALAAHVSREGVVRVANAGHLSPYVDGREIELPGALPLGVQSGASYDITNFTIRPGSRITFYSDGVVEAQNAAGELFGFERAREVSVEPAAVIVEAARHFGQKDDITVVTIERAAAAATAA